MLVAFQRMVPVRPLIVAEYRHGPLRLRWSCGIVGACSLFAALGIVDYTSRLVADVVKTSYAGKAKESTLYFAVVWVLVISASVGGVMMFIYSILLLVLNRRVLPDRSRSGGRIAVLAWSVALFGILSVLTIIDQGKQLFGD